MRNLRKKTNNGLGSKKIEGQIQPDHQKKKTAQSPMGAFSIG